MGEDVLGKCGKKAKQHYRTAVKARTKTALATAKAAMDEKTRAYLATRTKDDPKIHLYLAEAEVRGNDTGNKVESTNSADKAARMQPVDRAVVTLDALQRARFIRNQTAAQECTTPLPPKLQIKFEDIKTAAGLLQPPTIIDQRSERNAATVTSLSGAKEYTTNINGEGGSFMHDVHCECSEISARAFGFPCAHCVGHAEFLGITPEDIVHCKDTTVGWQRQYEGLSSPCCRLYLFRIVCFISRHFNIPL